MTRTSEAARQRAPAHGLFVEESSAATGAGAPLVVCVHGSMDRHASFARMRARLVDTCDVVAYDRRGYAASRAVTPDATGVDDHVADLAAVLDGRRAVVFGHSYGGAVALALAERRPDLVAAAVVYEPPLSWLEFWHGQGARHQQPSFAAPTPEQAAEAFLRRMVGDRRYERIPASTRAELGKDGPALVAELTAIRTDPAPFDPAAVTVPVVAACGSETADRHLRANKWLAERLPCARRHVVQGAGHDAHRTHARELAALVVEATELADSSDWR